jgi:hypothetical protein
VRLVSWWVTKVLVPLLKSPSWWRRATTIFVNNICVVSGLLVTGSWHWVALAMVAGLGVSMGMALNCLCRTTDGLIAVPPTRAGRADWRLRIGVTLNLLEPPAIVVTLGLCLGQRTAELAAAQVWEAFSIWVVGPMLIAACGEGLWLGVGRSPSRESQV